MNRSSGVIIAVIILFQSVFSQESVEFRGPRRDGKFQGQNLLRKWPESGPPKKWVLSGLGNGYSSVATDGKSLFLTSLVDSSDCLTSVGFDGQVRWRTPYGKAWMTSFPDSRCTPTIIDDTAYVTSGTGEVACLNAIDGRLIWKTAASELFGGDPGNWGYAESPVIYNDKVIFTPGGNQTATVALNRRTGKIIWKTASLNEKCAYVSPLLIEHNGNHILINVTSKHIYCIDVDDGTILSSFSEYEVDRPDWHEDAPIINCVTPLYKDGQVYLTSGYNHVGMLLRLSPMADSLTLIWKDTLLDNHHGGVVEVGGLIYGSNWMTNSSGNWCCIEWETGKKLWEEKWHTKGSLIFADSMLYMYEERTGNVALVRPSPARLEIVSTFRVSYGEGPHWSHPIIYNGVLYIRHGSDLAAYDIRDLSITSGNNCLSDLSERKVPEPRYQPGMVYNNLTSRVILFGGVGEGGYMGDMWELSEGVWRKTGDFPDLSRAGHSMAFNPSTGRLMMHGGMKNGSRLGSIWEYKDYKWIMIDSGEIPSLDAHQLVSFNTNIEFVIFGGIDSNKKNNGQTWVYTNGRWRTTGSGGPEARFHHTMVFDEGRGVVVLFGGNTVDLQTRPDMVDFIESQKGDTWEWDGKNWHKIEIAGPSPRDHHSMAYDKHRKVVVLFGGFNGDYLADTWEYDGKDWKIINVDGPPARGGKPGMVYDSLRKKVVLFGGGIAGGTSRDPEAMNDTWEWDGINWIEVNPEKVIGNKTDK